MSKEKLVIIFFSILTLCCPPVLAQITYEPTWSPPDLMALNNIKFNPVVNGVINNSDNQDSENNDLAPIKRVQVPTTFTLSKSRTRTNLQNFVDKTRASNPAQADKMEALFASADVIGQIGDVMANFGLSRNNAGDAFALYWVAAWQAAHSDTSTPSKAMVKAVASQAARGLSQSPEFAAADDAQKQEMAEALMLQAAMIDGHMEEAAGNTAQLRAVATAVKQGASASGLELDTMTLTEEGFREGSPRKRSDASDAGENEKALAANDTGTDGDGETNYALIAAAAGAGLGGVFLLGKAMGRRG
jgi:hypothetical protein